VVGVCEGTGTWACRVSVIINIYCRQWSFSEFTTCDTRKNVSSSFGVVCSCTTWTL